MMPTAMQQTPCTHRHPTFSETKPPMIGPRMGPRNGATLYSVRARPRWVGANMSARTPPELTMGEPPKVPVRKRKTIRVAMFWLPAEPPMKATMAMWEMIQSFFLP
jgi:hypothetical protein